MSVTRGDFSDPSSISGLCFGIDLVITNVSIYFTDPVHPSCDEHVGSDREPKIYLEQNDPRL